MNILDQIVADKRKEVALRKSLIPYKQLEASVLFERTTISLSQSLKNSTSGIIAEHKRRSPSKAVINQSLSVQDVAKGYEDAGVCGMSVLTDGKYFGGSLDDLLVARASCDLPLLRKEFIIDTYQILEAKAYGADVILLIAAILTKEEIKQFSELAKSLDLDVLLEVHNLEELQKSIMPTIDMLGVNNRNLKTFEVSLETSKALSNHIPDDFVKVSESGISSIEAIKELQPYGCKGFLIGENFMKTDNPGESAKSFIKSLLQLFQRKRTKTLMKKEQENNRNPIFPSGENADRQKGLYFKICGMKYNTAEVATLQPDYLGFIFYDKSPRNFEGAIPELPKSIKKVGVFVDETVDVIIQKIKKFELDAIQLHGNESPDYCKELKSYCHAELDSASQYEIIKVFSIKDEFNFSQLQPYEDVVDYFLFDTKGKLPGGNGYTFNWDVLKDYPSTKPYFLSGGIGLGEMDNVMSFLQTEESKYCHAIDINSKFEIKPGLKAIEKLEEFITNLSFRT